jgi:hypothetical protein
MTRCTTVQHRWTSSIVAILFKVGAGASEKVHHRATPGGTFEICNTVHHDYMQHGATLLGASEDRNTVQHRLARRGGQVQVFGLGWMRVERLTGRKLDQTPVMHSKKCNMVQHAAPGLGKLKLELQREVHCGATSVGAPRGSGPSFRAGLDASGKIDWPKIGPDPVQHSATPKCATRCTIARG